MNNLHNNLPPELFPPEEIVQVIFGFEKLIGQKQKSLNFPRGSQIEKAGLAAIEILDKFKRKIPHDFSKDKSKEWRQAIALADMLRKVLRAVKHPCFDKLWPHLILLLGDANIALNVWNRKEDSDANKIFELYMALVLAPLCPHLDLDDPKHSSGGTNPDIIAKLDGSEWAFSCKVTRCRVGWILRH
jgi:hypothetical protein